MAMSKSDFLSELARIEQGHLDAVYLLRGGELYLEDEAINTICQAFGKQESERYGSQSQSDWDTNHWIFNLFYCWIYCYSIFTKSSAK